LDQINARKNEHIKTRGDDEEIKELFWVTKQTIKKYLRGN